MDAKEIRQRIDKARAGVADVDAPMSPGVYGIFLREGAELPVGEAPSDGLIYIGRSDNLATRDLDTHFKDGQTGFSTVRRSIGAILKGDLGLVSVPRGRGTAKSNYYNYRFTGEGEKALTAWMTENLEVGVCPLPSDVGPSETALIAAHKPLLCLTGWENPWAPEIKGLRRACADEARATAR